MTDRLTEILAEAAWVALADTEVPVARISGVPEQVAGHIAAALRANPDATLAALVEWGVLRELHQIVGEPERMFVARQQETPPSTSQGSAKLGSNSGGGHYVADIAARWAYEPVEETPTPPRAGSFRKMRDPYAAAGQPVPPRRMQTWVRKIEHDENVRPEGWIVEPHRCRDTGCNPVVPDTSTEAER